MSANAIDCSRITVRFGEFTALNAIDVSFDAGRIHALVGQNGAGKTTLARVIAGLVPAAAGTVAVDGNSIETGNVLTSRSHGIEMVHQSFALPPSMTVAEALEYGSTRPKGSLFTRRSLNAYWQKYLDDSSVEVRANQRLHDLPIESLQAIEIARALAGDAKILILDEPTAVLPPESISKLFDRIRRLRDAGVTVIIVLHKVREVLDIADTVTVLRSGELILRAVPAESVTAEGFARAIIGSSDRLSEDDDAALGIHRVDEHVENTHRDHPLGPAALELHDVSSAESSGGLPIRNADLTVHSGEIVGVAGVEGNGQVALAEAIAGMLEIRSGKLILAGKDATKLGTLQRRAMGFRVIPFDRNTEGVSGSTPLWQNWAIPSLVGPQRRSGPVRTKLLREKADEALRRWDVKFRSVNQNASELSGGNVQKVILARELDEAARVIVAAQPTRGLDLGAVEFVWDALRSARDNGAAVLFISSDLDELAEICDRIIVVLAGEIVMDAEAPYDFESIGTAMTGASA
ncbi:ABC transporter ATP-binding protein [Microbacterium sp. 18062]|uniref:ABC transporter ATP-binding protein n=1 Tax=Microbacterium sp. 18062 TaxID=2681410 RepID=UPI00135B061D|nr:ATP-binding cassette domain-containing protein [Microbacterium sp. 18062]